MTDSNFFNGLLAITKDISLFFSSVFHNMQIIGFVGGLIVAVLITGFILTKNPRHIPIILKYSIMESFEKISQRDPNGTYQMAFSKFLQIYTQVRTLFFISFISFCMMIATIMVTYRQK